MDPMERIARLGDIEELIQILDEVPRSAFDTSSTDPRLAFVNEEDDEDKDKEDEDKEKESEEDEEDEDEDDDEKDEDDKSKNKVEVDKAELEELKRLRKEEAKRKRM